LADYFRLDFFLLGGLGAALVLGSNYAYGSYYQNKYDSELY